MGWVDGFAPSLAGVAVFGWPGLEEHLREILRKRKEEQQQEPEQASSGAPQERGGQAT